MKKMNKGDRQKFYESLPLPERFPSGIPLIVRLDGHNFHTFTKGLKRPYDENLSNLMVATCQFAVEETGALVGYTQSDEISLILHSEDYESQLYFDARPKKIMTILASKVSVFFNKNLNQYLPSKAHLNPTFDCRVHMVPNKIEAVNNLWWREDDATKNSISMAAQAYYSHNELNRKNSSDKHEMLYQKGVNWNDYPNFFRRGTYIQKKKVCRPFFPEELEKLPEHHNARKNPNLVIERQEYGIVDIPPLRKITNRIEVLFEGAKPILQEVLV